MEWNRKSIGKEDYVQMTKNAQPDKFQLAIPSKIAE
jgi:hypothetical protein